MNESNTTADKPDWWYKNVEAYKREATLAMSIADRIPMMKADQDQRSKNRFREHSGDGHGLLNSGRTSHRQPSHTLHTCLCDWVGWLIPKDEDDYRNRKRRNGDD